MVMRSADDAVAISKRIAELRQEETDRLNASCDCPDDLRQGGSKVKVHEVSIKYYGVTPRPVTVALPQQPQHVPDDDWATLKRQAQSPEAAFLLRLHLRLERDRQGAVPRAFKQLVFRILHGIESP